MKPIPECNGYFATVGGKIMRDGRELRARDNGHGYMQVTLSIDGHRRDRYVHRLVCAAYHGLPLRDMQVAHTNGCRSDNRPENLRWATKAENESDKEQHGTLLRGAAVANAVLSDDMVLDARKRVAGGALIRDVAAELGVSCKTLASAVTGRKWSWLPLATGRRRTVNQFSDAQVRAIRTRYAAGERQQALADELGVTNATISKIVLRQRYAHVIG